MYCAIVLYVQTRKGDNMDLLQMGAQMLAQQLGGIDSMANLAKGFCR